MAERFLCRVCGECAPLPYEALCRVCATVGESMPALGLSIARFVRACEIDELVDQVEFRMEHGPACTYVLRGNRPCDCGLGDSQEALDRLAALARDGGRNG